MVRGERFFAPNHLNTFMKEPHIPPPEIKAAIGNVNNQDEIIFLTVRIFPWLVAAAIPNKAPTETCVVETGTPNTLANVTVKLVTVLAVNPFT